MWSSPQKVWSVQQKAPGWKTPGLEDLNRRLGATRSAGPWYYSEVMMLAFTVIVRLKVMVFSEKRMVSNGLLWMSWMV